MEMGEQKIKIVKNGPYLVSGSIPLKEKIIVRKGKGYILKDGKTLPQQEEYALCRCGRSSKAPFCDGSHDFPAFSGTETASRETYEHRAGMLEGPEMNLMDDNRCAYARFCHRENGKVWSLTRRSDEPGYKEEAQKAAWECPSGRLVVVEKNGEINEPELEPCIEIAQDPEMKVSGGLFVKGGIPIEAADGEIYEVRNRTALCRCGRSDDKPFCDASHIPAGFKDKRKHPIRSLIALFRKRNQ